MLLNGTGFSPKVMTNEDVFDVGGGGVEVVGDVELFRHAGANRTTAVVVSRHAAVLGSTFHASQMTVESSGDELSQGRTGRWARGQLARQASRMVWPGPRRYRSCEETRTES